MSDPITQPAKILSAALNGPLSSVVEEVDGLPAWGWLKADDWHATPLAEGTIPGVITAYPTSPFAEDGYIGHSEIAVTVVIKAFALTDDGAQDLLAAAVAALEAGPLTPPAGYVVSLDWQAELTIPPGTSTYMAAASYAARIWRA